MPKGIHMIGTSGIQVIVGRRESGIGLEGALGKERRLVQEIVFSFGLCRTQLLDETGFVDYNC